MFNVNEVNYVNNVPNITHIKSFITLDESFEYVCSNYKQSPCIIDKEVINKNIGKHIWIESVQC